MQPLDILTASVRLVVGTKTAAPRPGQAKLCADIAEALATRTHVAGIAPTGSGKSFALLAAAMHRVVDFNERVLLSTESLSLQSQVLHKDAPTVVKAVLELGGPEVTVAVLKGVNNYVDPRQLFATAELIVGEVAASGLSIAELIGLIEKASIPSKVAEALDGADPEVLRPLLIWGLRQYLDPNAPGDRHSYDAPHTGAEWALVSAMSAEAAGEDDTPYFPKAMLAKELAAEADIVVTNHTLLAIQAANGIPIVIGNGNLGQFDHILIDEAHALPDEVRKQGASEVSGRTINSLLRAVRRVTEDKDRPVKKWMDDGEALADILETALRSQLGREETHKIGRDEDPLGNIGETLTVWAKRGAKLVEPATKSVDVRTMVRAKRAQNQADVLSAAINSVSSHHGGEARWIEAAHDRSDGKYRSWTSAQSSPVDVSGKLEHHLWVRPAEDVDSDEVEPLGVACVSATLPQGYPYQAGLATQLREYESPFTAAYANSMLYIPYAGTPEDIAAVTSDRYGKQKFDTKKHTDWAGKHVVSLVTANRGSALILAATTANGKRYAELLRMRTSGIKIHSQWEGETTSRLLQRWRADEGSVLVGTRSMMTGVDAPGETCTLVVLDRIPRRPSNPIDDARVEQLTDRLGDKWAADRFVYAADAALLTEQAIGRLIRSVNDSGMVAVLDPRLLTLTGGRRGPFTYPEQTRQIYMKPLYRFPNRTANADQAETWLYQRRAALTMAA